MRWHRRDQLEDGILYRRLDGATWEHFDNMYPNFAVEPQNVRPSLCVEGLNPYTLSPRSYSIWLVVVTLYNLAPELCMTTLFMCLTCVILDPKNSKNKIDVCL